MKEIKNLEFINVSDVYCMGLFHIKLVFSLKYINIFTGFIVLIELRTF